MLLIIGLVSSVLTQGSTKSYSADEVILKGGQLYLFQFARWRCKILDEKALKEPVETGSSEKGWFVLLKPSADFMAQQVTLGQNKNFLVLDIGGDRIWQLDSGLQTISSIELPAIFKNYNLSDFKMFYTAEQRLVFININEWVGMRFIESSGGLLLQMRSNLNMKYYGCFAWRWLAIAKDNTNGAFFCISSKNVQLFNHDFLPIQQYNLQQYGALCGNGYGVSSTDERLCLNKDGSIVKFSFGPLCFCFNKRKASLYECTR